MCYVGVLSKEELSGRLMKLLPRYILPSRYESLEAMPHNASGKIDRKLLKERFMREQI